MRVTYEQVKAAIEKNGVKLVRHVYLDNQNAVCYACALTQLALLRKSQEELSALHGKVEIEGKLPWRHMFHNELNLPYEYIDGFISGFDGAYPHSSNTTEEFILGFNDGAEVYKKARQDGLIF